MKPASNAVGNGMYRSEQSFSAESGTYARNATPRIGGRGREGVLRMPAADSDLSRKLQGVRGGAGRAGRATGSQDGGRKGKPGLSILLARPKNSDHPNGEGGEEKMKQWYYVKNTEGYVVLELADSALSAKSRARTRP